MSAIHQMRVEFKAPEDRLLFSVISRNGTEVTLWMTRRFVRLLWPNLVKLASSTPEAAAQQSPDARKSVLRFQHEKALASAKFGSSYDRDKVTSRPLGETPVLVTKARTRRTTDPKGPNQLSFATEDDKPITLSLDDVMLHSLCRLIRQASDKAEWNLTLGDLSPEARPQQAGQAATRLN
jgi:hypothetical protein